MTQAVPSLLLLIPAYNEESRIGPVLREFALYFRQHYPGKSQIVVVLNGCRDNTVGVVKEVAAEFPEVSFLDFPDPIGKGGALIEGLKLAPGAALIGCSTWTVSGTASSNCGRTRSPASMESPSRNAKRTWKPISATGNGG